MLTNAAGGVLAAAILATAAQLIGWIDLTAWWQAAGRAATAVWGWLTAFTPWPNWLLIVLSLALAAWALVFVALQLGRNNDAKGAPYAFNVLDYTSDTFFNMRWRWHWIGSTPHGIVPFCLECDMQIDPGLSSSGYLAVAPLIFPCRVCGEVRYETGHGDTDFGDVVREVTLLVQRNVRQRLASRPDNGSSVAD